MEGVSYGNKHKHIRTISCQSADAVQLKLEPVARASVIGIEDYFALGRQRRSCCLNEVKRPDRPHWGGLKQREQRHLIQPNAGRLSATGE